MSTAKERLFSLDILRGLDMIFLTVVGPILMAAGSVWHWPVGVCRQLSHPVEGFTAWDIIMPLFIFMCGAAVPFALSKRLGPDGRAGWPYWRHVLGRFALLWFIAIVVIGPLPSLDPSSFIWFSNTLQAIAVGYVGAAVVLLLPKGRLRFSLPFVLTAAYAACLCFVGDWTLENNCAMLVEKRVLNVTLPQAALVGVDLCKRLDGYTWYLPSLMFVAMTLFGMQATEILTSKREPVRKGWLLAGYGAALLAIGWALALAGMPMNKRIFTPSFTLQAMGWCMLALAVLYFVTDIAKCRRGTGLVLLYGRNSLAAYVMAQLYPVPCAFATLYVGGMPRVFGEQVQPFVLAVAVAAVQVWALVLWDRLKRK